VDSGYGAGLKRGGSRFVPPSVASPFGHGVAVLKARSMGRGIGGLGSDVRPPSRAQDTPTQCAPPSYVGGDCGLGGAKPATMLGG